MTVKLMTELDLAGKRVLSAKISMCRSKTAVYQRCQNQSRTAKYSARAKSRCQSHTDVPSGTTH